MGPLLRQRVSRKKKARYQVGTDGGLFQRKPMAKILILLTRCNFSTTKMPIGIRGRTGKEKREKSRSKRSKRSKIDSGFFLFSCLSIPYRFSILFPPHPGLDLFRPFLDLFTPILDLFDFRANFRKGLKNPRKGLKIAKRSKNHFPKLLIINV